MKKKTVVRKTPPNLLDTLVRAVCANYATDLTAPSIIVSYVSGDQHDESNLGYYASIIRYNGKFGRDREVLFRTSGHDSAFEAIQEVARLYVGERHWNDALRKMVEK